jgi:hypothetical protein
LDVENKKIYVETAKKLKKIANILNHNNTLYFWIDDPLLPNKSVCA